MDKITLLMNKLLCIVLYFLNHHNGRKKCRKAEYRSAIIPYPFKYNPIILRAVHALRSDQNNAKYHCHYVYASSHGQRTHFALNKYPTKYKNQTHTTCILIKNLNLVLRSIFRFSVFSFYRLQTTLAPQHCFQ